MLVRVLRRVWWVPAVALVVVGVLLAWHPGRQEVAWFAYSPSSAPEFSDGYRLVSPAQVAGALCTGLGLVVLGTGVGFLLGRRRTRRPDDA